MRRRATGLLVCGALAALAATCGGPSSREAAPQGALPAGDAAAAKTVTLRLGHALDTNHPVHKSLVHFGDRVKEHSNGTLELVIMPSGKLGGEREMVEQLQLGVLHLTKVASSLVESFVPEMGVFTLPYLFRDAEHTQKVLEGPIGKELLEAGNNDAVKLKGLCYLEAGARSFYLRDKPVLTPADLRGRKIRVQKSPIMVEFIRTLGASPSPIAWGELYTALQQGVVDGAENNVPSLHSAKHYEVCPYFSLTEHVIMPDVLLIARSAWERLDEAQRRALEQAAAEAAIYQRRLWDEATKANLEEMAKNMEALGKTFQVNNVDKGPFIEAVQPMYDQLKNDPTKAALQVLVERIRSVE